MLANRSKMTTKTYKPSAQLLNTTVEIESVTKMSTDTKRSGLDKQQQECPSSDQRSPNVFAAAAAAAVAVALLTSSWCPGEDTVEEQRPWPEFAFQVARRDEAEANEQFEEKYSSRKQSK